MTAMRGALAALLVATVAATGGDGLALPPPAARQGGPPPGVDTSGGGGPPPGVGSTIPANGRTCPNVPTVRGFELSAYTGRWYQVAVTALFAERTEDNKPCVTADYKLQGPNVQVINCKQDAPANATSRATVGCLEGVAFPPAKGEPPAELAVQFPGAPFPGPYNIIGLSGKASEGYRVALVYSCTAGGGFFSQGLFLLSRTPQLGFFELLSWYVRFLRTGIKLAKNNPIVLTPQGRKRCAYRGDKRANVIFE